MSLTQRQIQLIQSSFKKVEPISDKAAEIFYAKLFDYDPALRSLFKGDIRSQGRKLMSTLKVAVNGLDDLGSLVPVLQKLAIGHVDYGVGIDDYTAVGNALLYTLKTGLGADYDAETKEAWKTLYIVIAQVMREAAYPNFNAATYKNTKNYKK